MRNGKRRNGNDRGTKNQYTVKYQRSERRSVWMVNEFPTVVVGYKKECVDEKISTLLAEKKELSNTISMMKVEMAKLKMKNEELQMMIDVKEKIIKSCTKKDG